MLGALDVGHVYALFGKEVGHIVAESIVGHARDKAHFFTQPRQTDRDVCRRASQVLAVLLALGERLEVVYRVEVDRDPSHRDQIEFCVFLELNVLHVSSPFFAIRVDISTYPLFAAPHSAMMRLTSFLISSTATGIYFLGSNASGKSSKPFLMPAVYACLN